MSKNSEKMWKAISAKNFDEVEEIITNNPKEDLVNAINDQGNTLMMRLLSINNPPPLKLMQFIIAHKDFNIHQKSTKTDRTNLSAIISLGNPDIFSLIEHKPGISFVNGKTSLAFAQDCFQQASKSQQDTKDPNVAAVLLKRVKGLEAIAQKIRDKEERSALKLSESKHAMEMFQSSSIKLKAHEKEHTIDEARHYGKAAKDLHQNASTVIASL